MEKRGQITLFIILGIALLLAVVLVIVFREKLTIFKPDQLLPTETSAVAHYIEGCTDTAARDGLAILGSQGGYIWLPGIIEDNPLAVIDTGIKVPLWQYRTENRIPSIELMQSHLSRYVNENLKTCLGGLSDFKAQYTIVEKGDIQTETTLTSQLVSFKVTYPIDIINKEGKKITDIHDFQVDVPYKLKDMYEVAKAIMEKESADAKLEKITIDLLALDSSIPLVGSELSCSKKVWLASDVQSKIKTLARTNIPSIRVDSTSYDPVPADQPYVLNHYVWPVTELTYPNIRASFTFNDKWPFLFAVRPNTGAFLKSNELKASGLASFVCMQQWKFVYDLSFPVMVTVEDAENNFNLNFGIAVMIHNNLPTREPLRETLFLFEPVGATDESYCNNLYGDYTMRINTFDNVSDPSLGETYLPINNVNISFTCLKYTCRIGQSTYESGGAAARLDATFPYCVNGVLKATKGGYKPFSQFVTTTSGREVHAYLTPIKTITDYTVVKHVATDAGVTAARPLDPGEKAFISLKYFLNGTMIHESWGGYPSESDAPVHAMELLAEGNFPYQIEIFVTNEQHGLVGGYTGQWVPAWANLKPAQRINFHVVTSPLSSDNQMLAFISTLDKNSEKIPSPTLR